MKGLTLRAVLCHLGKLCTCLLLLAISCSQVLAQKGKDGAYTVSSGTNIMNRYAALTSSVSAGATSVTVDSISKLSGSYTFTNYINPYATAALSAGDLIMIIQVQGADIDTTNAYSYGTVTAYNNTGNYELQEVSSVSGNTIYFACIGGTGLAKAYSTGGRKRTVLVRVPRLTTLSISSGAVLTGRVWDGTQGGIVAIETQTSATLNGKINADTLGFRGGIDSLPNANAAAAGHYYKYKYYDTDTAAGKGENIAGTTTDMRSYGGGNGRGAPANGGGGGNSHNAGGGGGANAGSLSGWTGKGVPSRTLSWDSAWNLESPSFATSSSPGGGRGGYSYGATIQYPEVVGPANSAWAGNNRDTVGGFGGRPLDYNSNTRLFMGGGGGAGEGNNGFNGNGGRGGGIIYLLSHGTVSGADTVTANGRAGFNTFAPNGTDAAGGGGGGGAIVIIAKTSITGIAARANGGNGGNQTVNSAEVEGPGGGGGGGYIATTTSAISTFVTGGANGTTNSSLVKKFTAEGATGGASGTTATSLSYYDPSGTDLAVTARIYTGGATLCLNDFADYYITVTNLSTTSTSSSVVLVDTVPSGLGYISSMASNGSYDTLSKKWTLANALAPGDSAVLDISFQMTSYSPASNTAYLFSTSPKDCITSNNSATISAASINQIPTAANAGSNISRCGGTDTFTVTGNTPSIGTGQWSVTSGLATIATSPDSATATIIVSTGQSPVLRWTTSNTCGSSYSEIQITHSQAVTSNAGTDQTQCLGGGSFTLNATQPAIGTGLWTIGSGTVTLSDPTSPTSSATLSSSSASLIWTVTNDACSVFSTVNIGQSAGTPPTVSNAGADQTFCCASSATLKANTPGIGVGTWSLLIGPDIVTFSNINSPTATVSGLTAGTYTLQWTIAYGSCTSVSTTHLINNCISTTTNQGKDSTYVVNTSRQAVNRYSAVTASASAGSTTITVANINELSGSNSFTNSVNAFKYAALGSGDLCMIIQMQGADIDTTNTSTYGTVSAYNNTGNYEVFEVGKVLGNVITLSSATGLSNSYSAGGRRRTQVVRIPRFSKLTINSGDTLTAKAWNGTSGGIVALETEGNLIVNGTIDVSSMGFRGGAEDNGFTNFTDSFYVTSSTSSCAGKGEGIVGNTTDYLSLGGQRGRGAPANGGGGSSGHNGGGGGGSNAGTTTGYTGLGIPTHTTSLDSAWKLESASMLTMSSPGGGRGGYNYSSAHANPQIQGPNNNAWGGSPRRTYGGLGGRALDYNGGSRLFMGGGGGAGEGNNSSFGTGGAGAGIVYILCHDSVQGSGKINANGGAGGSTVYQNRDGAGGGGGGGAVAVLALNGISSITVNANGGNGGNQNTPITPNSLEGEGPGGGGGGGFVLSSSASGFTRNITGGGNGITNSPSLTKFTPNGATSGSGGSTTVAPFTDNFSANTDLSLTSSEIAAATVCQSDTFRIKLVVKNNNTTCNSATGVIVKNAIPATLYYVTSTSTNGSFNSSTGLWTLSSSLSNNDSATLIITTLVVSEPIIIANPFIVSSGQTDSNHGNDTTYLAQVNSCGGSDGGHALPVELLSFDTEKQGTKFALLSWATALEINNHYFEVQRSADGQNFSAIGKVMGAGNSTITNNYAFVDSFTVPGTDYYRLKQVDFNGKYSLTDIKPVTFNGGENNLRLYPNPANNYFLLEGDDLNQQHSSVQIVDMNGRFLPVKATFSAWGILIQTYQLDEAIYIAEINTNGIISKIKFAVKH